MVLVRLGTYVCVPYGHKDISALAQMFSVLQKLPYNLCAQLHHRARPLLDETKLEDASQDHTNALQPKRHSAHGKSKNTQAVRTWCP